MIFFLRRYLRIWIVIGAVVISFGLGLLPFFITLEHKSIDLRIRFKKPESDFGKSISLVLLDEALMDQLPCRSPVPRGVLADIINIISRAKPRLIALDVFLSELTWDEEDRKLKNALKESGKVILVSTFRDRDGKRVLDLPHPEFLQSALATGLADFPIDPIDQRVREFRTYYLIDGRKYPTLSTSMFLIDKGRRILPDKLLDMKGFTLDWLPIKRDRLFINYQGPPAFSSSERNVFMSIPASVLLTGLVPQEWFANKYVFIGAGYEDNPDSYRTPYYSKRFNYSLMPGVEIHANALATLLSGRAPHKADKWLTFIILCIVALTLLILDRFMGPLFLGISSVFMGGFYWILSFFLFDDTYLALPLISVSICIVLVYLFLITYRSLTEGKQKRWIKKAFSRYISPEFVDILIKRPDMLYLGGEEKELTIMFTDIQGFTSISEGIPPAELLSLLNEYLSGMTDILIAHGGTLDKYEGDAVMAFWGAPIEQKDHARLAVSAGLEMIRFTERLVGEFSGKGRPLIKTRIGINTGMVVVGNVGSSKRFNYTIIGDEVNLASRLESANKQYGTYFMISQSTKEMVDKDFHIRELDLIRVKGKERPVRVYEVLGHIHEELDDSTKEMLAYYKEGLKLYRNRKWKLALNMFQDAMSVCPEDGPSSTYVDRCRYFINNPPEDDWDGVFTLKTK